MIGILPSSRTPTSRTSFPTTDHIFIALFVLSFLTCIFILISVSQQTDESLLSQPDLVMLNSELFFEQRGGIISPWHDIDLQLSFDSEVGSLFANMVVEIPKGTTEKMEVDTTSDFNPIKQDTDENGALRFLSKPSAWNYGMLSQTFADPSRLFEDPKLIGLFQGDGDPLDVVELGSRPLERGEIVPVRILGALALIDQGELDWKILAIATDNQASNEELHIPAETVEQIRDWFRTYKSEQGKPENFFGFEGNAQPVDVALRVIQTAHFDWKQRFQH